jgi:hypothetical protein
LIHIAAEKVKERMRWAVQGHIVYFPIAYLKPRMSAPGRIRAPT